MPKLSENVVFSIKKINAINFVLADRNLKHVTIAVPSTN